MDKHKCFIGIYCDAVGYHLCSEKNLEAINNMNCNWMAKFKYCPECGKKIKWQERTRMDISTHALEGEDTQRYIL